MIKALIFDCYGTLVDTADGSIKATKKILEKNNSYIDPVAFYATWKKYYKEYIYSLKKFLTEADIFRLGLVRLYDEFGINGNAVEDVEIMLSTLGVRKAFPETVEVLNQLHSKYQLYIGSNSDYQPLLCDIKRNRIVVNDCFSSESLACYKPQTVFFQRMLNLIDLNPEEVVYIGDSQEEDIKGAYESGINAIWINRKNHSLQKEIPKPYLEITNLAELLSTF